MTLNRRSRRGRALWAPWGNVIVRASKSGPGMAKVLAELKRRHIYRVAAGYAVVAWFEQALALEPDDSDGRVFRLHKRFCGAAQ